MTIYETYSMRKKAAARAGQPDAYVYDDLPKFLRQQIVMIWRDVIGPYVPPRLLDAIDVPPNANRMWDEIAVTLARECEAFHDFPASTGGERCEKFLLTHRNVDECIDLIEL